MFVVSDSVFLRFSCFPNTENKELCFSTPGGTTSVGVLLRKCLKSVLINSEDQKINEKFSCRFLLRAFSRVFLSFTGDYEIFFAGTSLTKAFWIRCSLHSFIEQTKMFLFSRMSLVNAQLSYSMLFLLCPLLPCFCWVEWFTLLGEPTGPGAFSGRSLTISFQQFCFLFIIFIYLS